MIIDPRIVDLLEGFAAAPWQGRAWRHVFEGRECLAPSHAGGRWAPKGAFPILYTSLSRQGALAEADHVISRYGIAPSRRRLICEIEVKLGRAIDLTDAGRLARLGIKTDDYANDWGLCPEIGAAANFLGYQGLLAPNSRHQSTNLMILTDQLDAESLLEVQSEEPLSTS